MLYISFVSKEFFLQTFILLLGIYSHPSSTFLSQYYNLKVLCKAMSIIYNNNKKWFTLSFSTIKHTKLGTVG